MPKADTENGGAGSDAFNGLFRKLMSDADVSLYPFQQKVARLLLSSHSNIILRAPTGSGKTWATLLPFLQAKSEGSPLADRILYALPLRSLASQLYASTVKACRGAGFRVKTAPDSANPANVDEAQSLVITLQTGEQQDDPFFQGDIVFTTIDQLLSSYILDPVSLPGRLANINAGAILGSLVVFDEFHLLEPDKSMGTAIEMLDRLKPYCRFILMTATLSNAAVQWLGGRLGAEIVELGADELASIESWKQEPTSRKWVWSNEVLSAQSVLDAHRKRTLVIVNTVARAQEIYRELIKRKKDGTDICLLHARFFKKDRLRWENVALSRLGKENQSAPEDFILVSTQVVEAGMDFSVDVLHTDLAPMNSLIQRAGRCVRYGGTGYVYVYPVQSERPYNKDLVGLTRDYLVRQDPEKVFTYANEMDAIKKIHSASEGTNLGEYDNLDYRRLLVNKAMDGLYKGGAREQLIRDINAVNILITDEPEKLRFDQRGGWPELVSVPYGTLYGFLRHQEVAPGDWLIGIPAAPKENLENERVVQFTWQRIAGATVGLPWLVAVNPRYARYSPQEGLLLGSKGGAAEIRYRTKRTREGYSYRCETYSQHIGLVLKHLEKDKGESALARRLLATELNISEGLIIQAARTAVILHDVGKLTVKWQDAACKWQEHKTPGKAPKEPLAHTDFDPKTDWESRRNFKDPPAHAAEGAYAVSDYLLSIFADVQEVGLCVFTAIARHHGGHTHALKSYSLIPEARPVISKLVAGLGLQPPQRLKDKPDNLTREGGFADRLLAAINEEDVQWLPLYWYLVRCLRLADQAGTAEGGR